MGLDDRLLPTSAEVESGVQKIPHHQFAALLREYARTEATRQNLIDAFTLVGTELTHIDLLLGAIDAQTGNGRLLKALEIEDVILLAERGILYPTKAAIRTRLGL